MESKKAVIGKIGPFYLSRLFLTILATIYYTETINGCVEGSLMTFASKTTGDYHEEMHAMQSINL